MKTKLFIISLLLIAGCNTTEPIIVPANTNDNIVMLQLKDQISQPGPIQPSYGWVIWYIPVAIISFMAAWRYLIKKPSECEEDNNNDGYDDDGSLEPKKPE
jgi:hypothetical protein